MLTLAVNPFTCIVGEAATRQTRCVQAFDRRPLHLKMNDFPNAWSIGARSGPIGADPNFSQLIRQFIDPVAMIISVDFIYQTPVHSWWLRVQSRSCVL